MSTAEFIVTQGGVAVAPTADIRHVMGHLCNLDDSGLPFALTRSASRTGSTAWNFPTTRNGPKWLLDPAFQQRPRAARATAKSQGRVIWTPALPGAPAHIRQDWYRTIRNAGGTHCPIGGFTPGYAYPGVEWPNPDWTNDPRAIRGLLEEILTAGLYPIVFLHGGGPNPIPECEAFFPVAVKAMDGLWDNLIAVPCGWEPVKGDWRSSEASWALREWDRQAPKSIIAAHMSPYRPGLSSNPIEEDDPWQGEEAGFYLSHGGEHVQVVLYQLDHVDGIFHDCACPNGAQKYGHLSSCAWDRPEDSIGRIAAGDRGWKQLPFSMWETVAWHYMRRLCTSEQAREVAARAQRIADKWTATIGHGNGLPL